MLGVDVEVEEQARGDVRDITGTRFTRVTVIGPHRRLDLSVPAEAPLIEVLPTVLRMLSVPLTGVPTAWRLATPELGAIAESRSLDDVGVLDGAQLHLVEAASAPPPPFVDDVESAVAESVSDLAPSWTGSSRRGVTSVLLSVVLLAAVACGWTAPPPINWVAPLTALLGAAAAGWFISERGGWGCAVVVPAAARDPVLCLGRGRITTGPAGVTRGIHESGSVGRVSDHSRICGRGRSRGGGGDPPRSRCPRGWRGHLVVRRWRGRPARHWGYPRNAWPGWLSWSR